MSNRQVYRSCPVDWTVRPIGEVFGRVVDRNLEGCQNVLTISAELGLVSQTEYFKKIVASDHLGNYFLLRKGDFAYNKSHSVGFPFGVVRCLLAYEKGVLSPLYICIRCRRQEVDGDYARAFFEANLLDGQLSRVADQGARDHGLLNVRPADFLAMKFWHPPIEEQRRIAEILDTSDETIRKAEQLLAKLQLAKQGLLHDLLTRGFDDNGELRDPERHPEHFKDTELGILPKAWVIARLDDVAERGSGHTPSKNVPSYWNGGIKWVSLADSHRLDQIYIYETDKEISELGIANSSAVKHPPGTVILSRDAGIGKSAITTETMAVSQHFMAWYCGPLVRNLYLYYWLQHNKPKFESIALGSTIKTIGLSYFKKLRLPVPPLPEQESAVSALLSAETAVRTTAAEIIKLRKLKTGLMDELLTGRVRVPLDTKAAA